MSLDTECFSMYSLISKRMIASLEPNNSSANVLDNSVFPTPVGPTKGRSLLVYVSILNQLCFFHGFRHFINRMFLSNHSCF